MMTPLRAAVFLLLFISLGAGSGHASGNDYCERLDEMELMPFNSRDRVDDEIYNGLMGQGRRVAACLLAKVTDTRLMRDPRKAPFYGGFTVGDAAVMLLTDICGLSIEDFLPASVQAKWHEQGVYAYFAFVEEGVENRRQVADALRKQGCRFKAVEPFLGAEHGL